METIKHIFGKYGFRETNCIYDLASEGTLTLAFEAY